MKHKSEQIESWYRSIMLPFKGNAKLLQPRCWVCGASSTEDHHVVPRTYGGENGPQVSLCGNCHTCLHHISFMQGLFDLDTIISTIEATGKAVKGHTDIVGTEELARIWALSYTVYRSRFLCKDSPEGKNTKMALSMPWARKKRLEILAKSFGLSQVDTIHYLVDTTYERLISSK